MKTESPKRPPLTPKYWPGWLSVGLIWLIGRSSQSLGLAMAAPLSRLLARFMKRRYHIALRNVERCFPELTTTQCKPIVDECFHSLARTLFEVAWSWSASDRRLLQMGDVVGLEHLYEAGKRGKGVLLVTAHSTCLEIGARLFGCRFHEMKGMYRPLKNPVLEWYQTRARTNYSQGMISKHEMRSAIRYLRNGGILWYAPDQDFGPDESVFVPFFGIKTATLLATHRLVRMTGCLVVPMFPSYDVKTGRYETRIFPPLENAFGDDPITDLARINAILEEHVRKTPGQYWWIHRRFKTRPEGEPPFYD